MERSDWPTGNKMHSINTHYPSVIPEVVGRPTSLQGQEGANLVNIIPALDPKFVHVAHVIPSGLPFNFLWTTAQEVQFGIKNLDATSGRVDSVSGPVVRPTDETPTRCFTNGYLRIQHERGRCNGIGMISSRSLNKSSLFRYFILHVV